MYFIFEAIALCVLSIGLLHYRVDSAIPFRSTTTTKCHRACHPTDANKINIHMIPHTHDDVGWLKTVDQYYYGSNKHNALPGVQYILDSVTSELMKNSDRRFVFVESAYFWAWWDEQDDKTRSIVNQLVDEGRLQFLHGGWCMSDEATPHYSAMIDQMTLGLKFLNDTFGECGRPTAAWQIDPFGHSSEVAIEFAEMGFDGLFVGRIDYDDRRNRKNAKTMEMVWKPDPSLGEAGELFTTVFYESYSAPGGFCFDIFCNDDPIMDNKKLHGYNVDDKVTRFESIMKDYSSVYKSRHIAVTFGDDFTYTVASAWFKNMDKLIKYANNRSDFHLLYSTPSCYLEAINAENLTWPVKESDDFFPYASDDHSYWTGYFTSRPTFKGFTYLSNNILQATKQLATLIGEKLSDEEFSFKKAVAIAQHHDGVSGTEKQHVTDDYALYLDQGLEKGETIITQVYREVYGEEDYPDQNFCTLRNISECGISEDWRSFVVTVYNPLSRTVSYPIRVPVTNNFSHRVFLHNGTEVEVDLIPIPNQILNLPGRMSKATHDLTFVAKNLPALGVISYYVEVKKQKISPKDEKETPENNDTVVLDNGIIKLIFNKSDGMLQSVTKDEVTWALHQNFYFYNATKGYNYDTASRASGAYIFRPTGTEPQAASSSATITRYQGNNVFEVRQKFTSWISQVVRLYKNVSDIEFEWVVGEIPIVDWTGLEVVSKYLTDIASNKTFYTDSNGRRWMKRIRDYRKYWNLSTSTETVSRNYYPLTSAICLRDSSRQATLLIDRPEGGTSMRDGEIEIMLHRRLMYDDAKGVGEALDEKAYGKGLVVRGRHTLQLNILDAADTAHRFKAVESQYAPISTLSKSPFTRDQWIDNYRNKSFSVIAAELPPNVHLLTLERWRKDQVLIRMEHIFQADETPQYARPVDLNIEELFTFFKVNKIQELSLAANWEKNKLKRLKWQSQGSSNKVPVTRENNTIILQPMQIRTFLLDVERK